MGEGADLEDGVASVKAAVGIEADVDAPDTHSEWMAVRGRMGDVDMTKS